MQDAHTAALARPAVAGVLLAALSRGNGAPGAGPRSLARRGGGSGTRTRQSDCHCHGVGPGPDAVGGGRGELGSCSRGRRRGQGRTEDILERSVQPVPGPDPVPLVCTLGRGPALGAARFPPLAPEGLGQPLSAFLRRGSASGWMAAAREGFAEKPGSAWECVPPVQGVGRGGAGKEGFPGNRSFQTWHAGGRGAAGRRQARLVQRTSGWHAAGPECRRERCSETGRRLASCRGTCGPPPGQTCPSGGRCGRGQVDCPRRMNVLDSGG